MKKRSIHSLIATAAAAAALLACGAAQAAQLDLAGGTAIGHIAGVGDQSLLTLHAALSATDPAALPLIARLDIAQGLQSGGLQEQTLGLGLGLYRFVGPAGAWRLEAGAEAGRWRDAGYTSRHVAGVLRASYAIAPAVALDSTLKLGHSSGLLGGRYTALGFGLDLFQIDGGTVRIAYQHIRDGALPSQDRFGLNYGLSF
ncbi:hypothetical protein GALL_245040 [mine drainage metagenome]|uniref:Uncharacterized protein n=1 Tax=mine drainage metagenome TaxID=410659 RepID=A0A1J5RBT5_9ZZZZ